MHRVNSSSTSYSGKQARSRMSRKNRSRHYGVDFIRLSHRTLSLLELTGLGPLVLQQTYALTSTDCQTALLRKRAANRRNAASCYATVLAITDQTPATQRTYCPKVAASSRIPTSPECRCPAVKVSAGAPVCRSVSQVLMHLVTSAVEQSSPTQTTPSPTITEINGPRRGCWRRVDGAPRR